MGGVWLVGETFSPCVAYRANDVGMAQHTVTALLISSIGERILTFAASQKKLNKRWEINGMDGMAPGTGNEGSRMI